MSFLAVGAILLSGALSNRNSRRAADANQNTLNAQIAESGRQFDINQTNFKPFLETGTRSNALLDNILNTGDISSLQNDPLIKFQLENANQSSNRSAAARGRLGSGANSLDLLRRSGGVLNNRINQLFTLSGRGQNAAGSIGTSAANAANANINSLSNFNQTNQGIIANQGANQQNVISNSYFAFLQNQKQNKLLAA